MKSTHCKLAINSLMIMIILLSIATISGCHRSYYRRQADAEVNRLITEKTVDPRWNSIKGDIEIDSRSRMHDPFSKDHPPIPSDDPASHQLMQQVDDKPGYPHWHANGDISEVENPLWKSYLPVNESGQVSLSLERAYQLALLHSPDLQSQHETLYESALNVSLERFGFDGQLFGGFNSFFTTQGRLAPGGSQSNLSTGLGTNGGGINLERMGITGTNFAVGLANTIVFNFAGNNTQTANSILDFSIIQPLLQNAGRSRILEALTQSERTLLANVRQLERFKRGFYLQIAIGRNPGAGPNLGGNFLGTPASGGLNAAGFLGLLEQQQQIRNQEFNVRQLETVLNQFVEYAEAGLLSQVQLKLFQASFYTQQRVLLDAKTNYQTSLDNFKALLGLPPNLEVVINDDFLDRFNLVSNEINDRLISIGDLRQDAGDQLSKIDNQIASYYEAGFQWPTDLEQQLAALLPVFEKAKRTIQEIRDEDFAQLKQDFDLLREKREDRTKYLGKLTADVAQGRIISSVSPDIFEPSSMSDPNELQALLSQPANQNDEESNGEEPELDTPSIQSRLELLEASLEETQGHLEGFAEIQKTLQGKALHDHLITNFQQVIPGQLSELNNIALDLSLLQAQARANSIDIINSEIASEHAIRIARCLRRDWMNARASLVDQYRNIEFVADQLEAGIDLEFTGSIGNDGNNPFAIRTENGQLQAGLRFDAPIVRLSERNSYRTALIDYQQSKRDFYQFEDSVKGDLRELVRNLGRNRVRFELDRRSVQVQIENVEINRLELDRPITASNRSLGTTTARNLTEAIIGLNSAQNAYLSTWVQYEVLRRNLDFDMGTMQLDAMGQWIDPGPIDDQIGLRALARMGAQPDCEFCENIGTAYEQATQDQAPESQLEDPFEPNVETDKSEITGEIEAIEPATEKGPSPDDLSPPNPAPADLVDPPDPRLQLLDATPELPEVSPELRKPAVPAPAIEAPVSTPPAAPEKRFQQMKIQPIELPTALPISEPLSAAPLRPTGIVLQAIKLQPIQPASLTKSFSKQSLETAEVGGVASWPVMQPESDTKVGLASAVLTQSRQNFPLTSPNDGSAIQPNVTKPALKTRLNPITTPSEKPQSEPLFYTLPPLNVFAGSTFQAPLAEIQQKQTPAIVAPQTDVAPAKPANPLVPAKSSFGGLLNRFQEK